MRSRHIDIDDLVNSVADAVGDKPMARSAYILHENVLDAGVSTDIDISEDIQKIAARGTSDILDVAHPGGSTKLQGIDAVSHDLKDTQAAILAVLGDKKVKKLAQMRTKLVRLAGRLEAAGRTDDAEMAKRVAKLLDF